MMNVTHSNHINSKLIQFKFALGKELVEPKWAIDNIKDINYKVIATNYLQEHHPELIGYTPLHFAAHERDSEFFEVLLNHGANFTTKNSTNLTPLHLIIKDYGSLISSKHTLDDPFVNLILAAHLKYGVFQNPVSSSGLSHFHIACAANNLEVVRGFINSGVPVHHTVDSGCTYFPGFSPLHFAATFCASEVAGLLVSHGADVHLKDAKGRIPLHAALERKLEILSNIDSTETARDKNEQILQLLLGKERNNGIMIISKWGLTNFHVICTLKNSKIVKHFLQNKEDINSIVSMDSPLWPGYTASHFAALCNIDTLKLLLKRGADINIRNAKGVTPFDLCIEKYKPQDIHVIISLHPIWRNITLSDGKTKLSELVFAMRDSRQFELFLKKLSKNFGICDSPLWPGYSPMHLAVLFTMTNDKESVEVNLKILRILREQCPDMLHSQDVRGYTPTHLAFRLNKKPVVDLLIKLLLDCPNLINRVDEDGLSYMHIASACGVAVYNMELGARLFETGVRVDDVYEGPPSVVPNICPGSTALHFAVVNGCAGAVGQLVEVFGADVYAKNAHDMTPIHMVLLGKREVGEKLLESELESQGDVEDSVVNGIGLSHLHVACLCGNLKVVESLLKNGANVNQIITYKRDGNEGSSELSFLEKYANCSPLSIACMENNEKIVSFLLLHHDADMFVEDVNGKPLLYSILEQSRSELLRLFSLALEDLQARLEAETGMTILHVACHCSPRVEPEIIEALLDQPGADPNAQIHSDSPIFPGYTPLHLLVSSQHHYIDDKVHLFIDKGADVTIIDAKSETAIHKAYSGFLDQMSAERRVNALLEAQRDFSVNPTSVVGISHLHIASSVGNAGVVEDFLNHAEVDVDRPIDHFYDGRDAGRTALHLVAESDEVSIGLPSQLETVDVLLRHGANFRAEDAQGDTPLHVCARRANLDLFERIARAGADVNARNVYGNTPLDEYLSSSEVCSSGVKALLRRGCSYNFFYPITDKGYLGESSYVQDYEDFLNLFVVLVMNFPENIETDRLGRTVIHNLVSVGESSILARRYPELIEQVSRLGLDVDDQDKLGRSALHLAAKFHNFNAVAGLLMAGADVNVVDNNGKAAFACDFDSCKHCNMHLESGSGNDTDDADAGDRICQPLTTIETLVRHVKKLQYFGIDVSEQNEDFASACKNFEQEIALSEDFFEELEATKNTRIGPHALTLHDFLSEYGAVAGFPRMSIEKRIAVNRFFSPRNMRHCREKFPELTEILQLQYRKAKVRSRLIESAQNALAVCAGFRLPEICSDLIVIFLRNSELKKLIASTLCSEASK